MTTFAAWSAVVLIVLGLAWLLARAWQRIGKTQVQAMAAKKAADQAKRAKEIDDEVRGLADDDLDRRLRGDD